MSNASGHPYLSITIFRITLPTTIISCLSNSNKLSLQFYPHYYDELIELGFDYGDNTVDRG